MSLASLYVYENLVYIKENLHNFQSTKEIHSYNVRSNTNIRIPLYKLNKQRNGANYLSIKFFNQLPDRIKKLPTAIYKNKIKNVLIEKCLYNFQEFFDINSKDFL